MKHVAPTTDWPEDWLAAYAFDCEEVYGQIRNRGYAYSERQQQTLQMVQMSVPAGARLLDIVAAQSYFSLAVAEAGYKVTWNDLRSDLVNYVKLKHQNGLVSYAAGNPFELYFARPFDAVLITEVVEHVAHPDEFLAKLAELVKPGGAINNPLTNGHLKMAALLGVLTHSWAQLLERLTQRLPSAWQQKLLIQIGVVLRKPLYAKL